MPRPIRFLPGFFLIAVSLAPLHAEPPLPTSVDILTQKDFVAGPYLTVADVLDGHPGLHLQRDGSMGTLTLAKFRGATARDTAVLLDGLPIDHDFDGEVDLSQIPLNIVDHIEITRGGSPLRYDAGGGGGVINIVTVRPSQRGLETHLGTGVGRYGFKYADGRFHFRDNLGDFTYVGQKFETNNFMTHEGASGTSDYGNWTRSFFDGKGLLGLDYFYHDSSVDLPEGTLAPFSTWDGHVERVASNGSKERNQAWQHLSGLAQINDLGGGRLSLTATDSWRDAFVDATDQGPHLRNQKNQTLDNRLSWTSSVLDIGLERLDLRRELETVPTHKGGRTGGYATGTFQDEHWTAKAGLRYENIESVDYITTPRVVLAWSPQPLLTLSATSQRIYRAPSWDELFVTSATLPNPDLKLERGWSHDLGLAFRPGQGLEAKITGFFAATHNTIEVDPLNNQWANLGSSERTGAETELDWKWGNGSPYRTGGLTSQWTFQRALVETGNGSGFVPASLTPNHHVSAELETKLPWKWTLVNQGLFESEQFENPDHSGLRVPSHYVWNLRVKMKILKADVYVAAQNITGQHYARSIAHTVDATGAPVTVLSPQPNHTYYAGISVRFDN